MARWTTNSAGPVAAHNAARGRSALTPMIDVTFLLLTFFLLTFMFRQAEGYLPGSLPRRVPPGIEIPMEIIVWPAGTHRQAAVFEIEGGKVPTSSPAELGQRLLAMKQQGYGEMPIVIRCRGDVQWRWAVEAYNQAVRAKYEIVTFAPAE